MEIQTRVALTEKWPRDDLEGVYALLFRFLGFGFRLAMSNVGWLVTQKFVILVPDPIAFAPRPALRRLPSGDKAALRAGASLVTVDVLTGHICPISYLAVTLGKTSTTRTE